MPSKNKVNVTVKGKRNRGVFAGGTIGGKSSDDSENVLKASIEGEDNTVQVAGADIIVEELNDLGKLIASSQKKKDDREYVGEIVQELAEQASKPETERNEPKIKGLLNSLGKYVGLASYALTQGEKIRTLFEHVMRFFGK
jgi:hypothetical protein